jgi:hypothetical protein
MKNLFFIFLLIFSLPTLSLSFQDIALEPNKTELDSLLIGTCLGNLNNLDNIKNEALLKDWQQVDLDQFGVKEGSSLSKFKIWVTDKEGYRVFTGLGDMMGKPGVSCTVLTPLTKIEVMNFLKRRYVLKQGVSFRGDSPTQTIERFNVMYKDRLVVLFLIIDSANPSKVGVGFAKTN